MTRWAVVDSERLGIVALAAADVALDPDVGQEVHFDLFLAVAFAGLAASARFVEAEPPRLVAAHLRLGQLGEQLTDQVEDAGIRRRVGRRRVAEGVLVDVDDLVDLFEALDLVVGGAGGVSAMQAAGEGVVEHLVNERRLA
ncbi:MAG: hypothetical protein HYS12_03100 [Planctomycetes bacterium]|nr:hypothetical protein [Planctomycetota bacterium]